VFLWNHSGAANRTAGRKSAIAYLCSLQAGYLTGQTIVVDGGINRSI